MGEEDTICKPAASRLIRDLIPDEVVYIQEIEGASHLYFNKANGEEIVEDIIDQLKQAKVRPAKKIYDEREIHTEF